MHREDSRAKHSGAAVKMAVAIAPYDRLKFAKTSMRKTFPAMTARVPGSATFLQENERSNHRCSATSRNRATILLLQHDDTCVVIESKCNQCVSCMHKTLQAARLGASTIDEGGTRMQMIKVTL